MHDDLNPYSDPDDSEARWRETLSRAQKMQAQMPGPKIDLPTLPKAVAENLVKGIETVWNERARNSGRLFKEKTKDAVGRDVIISHGDIEAFLRPFMARPIRFRLADRVYFEGRTYLANRVPPDIQRAMTMKANCWKERS